MITELFTDYSKKVIDYWLLFKKVIDYWLLITQKVIDYWLLITQKVIDYSNRLLSCSECQRKIPSTSFKSMWTGMSNCIKRCVLHITCIKVCMIRIKCRKQCIKWNVWNTLYITYYTRIKYSIKCIIHVSKFVICQKHNLIYYCYDR